MDHRRLITSVTVFLVLAGVSYWAYTLDSTNGVVVLWTVVAGVAGVAAVGVAVASMRRSRQQDPVVQSEKNLPLPEHQRVRQIESMSGERAFVGRKSVFRQLEQTINDASLHSGYIRIRGEPGIGKTALVEQWSGQYVHHFNSALEDVRSTKEFLLNVCSQLIMRYELDHSDLPRDAGKSNRFLSLLLQEAVAKEGRPIIVLVDALDEAIDDVPNNRDHNRLLLPAEPPGGVFFIVTSREPDDYRLETRQPIREIFLRDDDEENKRDVKAYVEQYVDQRDKGRRLRVSPWQLPRREFVDVICKRSEGNFMYLVHVLEDIYSGVISPETIGDVNNLPQGLRAYYQRHWRTMKANVTEFEGIYEPVLRTLAIVHKPVTVEFLSERTEVPSGRIREVIRRWRPFLNEQRDRNDGNQTSFRLYHTSFRDFLIEEEPGLDTSLQRVVNKGLEGVDKFVEANRPPDRDDG